MSYFELVTVRVRSETGEEGLGYTYTTGVGGAAIHAMITKDLTALLLQKDARGIESIWHQMWWRLHWVGRGGAAAFAVAAVDIALWDLKAKQIGEPLWRLLGGNNNRVKAYAGGVDLQLSLDDLCEQTHEFVEGGFRAIKMKVGRERLAEDVERVAKIRELIGPDVPLMIDANMIWSVDRAVRAARALVDYDIFWLEEPTIPDDIQGHAKIAHLAEAYNLPVTTHGVHDLQVHLLAAVSNASYLEVHGFGLERFTRYPFQLADGDAIAPDRPGHGVDLHWEALESYRQMG